MKRGFPILAIVTALLLSYALYEALIGAPTERTHGRRAAHLLLSRALGVDGVPALPHQLRRFGRLSYPPQRQGRHSRPGQRRSWRGILHRRPGDRADLGAAGLGHLVDVGLRAYTYL